MSRPEKPVNWKQVEESLMAGCLGTEIAAKFDMHPNTFYDRVLKKYNVSFTEYSSQKKSKGDASLKEAQFKKALSGDNSMLIWLGKNRLGQRDKEKMDRSEVDELVEAVLEANERLRNSSTST